MASLENLLRKNFPELQLSVNRSYLELTTFGIGSAPVPLLAEVRTTAEAAKLLRFLHARKIKTFYLGAGSNIVGSDTPFDGVMIRLDGKSFSEISVEGDLITCGGAARLPVLAKLAAKAGLKGFSPLFGIPGSVGGAIRMNAGANGTEIGSLVHRLEGVRADGSLWSADAADIQWFYRDNTIAGDIIITKAVFKLAPGDPGEEELQIAAEQEKRRSREPSGRSAGCAFRNVSPFEPAGKLIDLCGLRGLNIGDLQISSKHANYLLNCGKASEADYIKLVRIIRRAVSEKFGFHLINEIVPVNPETTSMIELDTPPPRVNVLYGGTSSERPISLQSGSAVAAALRHAGFKVDLTDIRCCEVTRTMRESDVVYPVLHGGFGENGDLQKLMEDAKLHFVGSGSSACALVMDKIATKQLLQDLQLPTAPWAKVSKTAPEFPAHLKFPVMLKAPCEGSTVGIVKVNSIDEWQEALENEFKFSDELLVEEFIKGVEITVPVLNSEVLEAIEIQSPTGFYDWDAKYEYKNGETQYLMPPPSLSPEVIAYAKELALKFYHATRSRDILRVDFIVSADNVPMILEGNSLPGNTSHSLVPQSAKHAGISMEKLTSSLVYAAMKRASEPEGLLSRPAPGSWWGDKTMRILTGMTKWIFRLLLVMTAATLFMITWQLGKTLPFLTMPLLCGGTLLLLAEIVFTYFRNMEKK